MYLVYRCFCVYLVVGSFMVSPLMSYRMISRKDEQPEKEGAEIVHGHHAINGLMF